MALWWRFSVNGAGVHQFRAKNLGVPGEEITIDGAPVEAPVGTTLFTGPGGSLLELKPADDSWRLYVDGTPAEPYDPSAGGATVFAGGQTGVDAPCRWRFEVPGAGTHEVEVQSVGRPGQAVYIDGGHVPGPEGQVAFTGPGATLLELKEERGEWVLLVDGRKVAPVAAVGDDGRLSSWSFFDATLASHTLQIANLGFAGQSVFLDAEHILAPDGVTAFTGPGGLLLEVKQHGGTWNLYVDGVDVTEHNWRLGVASPAGHAPAVAPPRPGPLAAEAELPQGVSLNRDTGKFQANVRVGARFVNLGEFPTPEEASAKYQGAKHKQG